MSPLSISQAIRAVTRAARMVVIAIFTAKRGFAGALLKFLGVFAVTQIPLAIGEGLLGVLLFRALTVNARPELERLGILTPAPVETTAGGAA